MDFGSAADVKSDVGVVLARAMPALPVGGIIRLPSRLMTFRTAVTLRRGILLDGGSARETSDGCARFWRVPSEMRPLLIPQDAQVAGIRGALLLEDQPSPDDRWTPRVYPPWNIVYGAGSQLRDAAVMQVSRSVVRE